MAPSLFIPNVITQHRCKNITIVNDASRVISALRYNTEHHLQLSIMLIESSCSYCHQLCFWRNFLVLALLMLTTLICLYNRPLALAWMVLTTLEMSKKRVLKAIKILLLIC
jgi:hypothetical protein